MCKIAISMRNAHMINAGVDRPLWTYACKTGCIEDNSSITCKKISCYDMMLMQFCCLTYPQQIIVKIFSRCSLVQQQRLLLCHHVRMSRKPPLNEAQCCQIAPKWPPNAQ